ncbi:lymphocyte antigen 75-like isoform X2 [Festucalex cinctus]
MKATQWLLGQALLTFGVLTFDNGCDPDEVPFGGFCYYFHDEDQKVGWKEAKDFCITRKSKLTIADSVEEFRFLRDNLKSAVAWTGLEIAWCYLLDKCGLMTYTLCARQEAFICKKRRPVPDTMQQPDDVTSTALSSNGVSVAVGDGCGGWVHNPSNDFCYLFNNSDQTTWADARDKCKAEGGDLLSITDLTEQNFLQDFLQGSWNGAYLWMGGRCSNAEGDWQWSDGSRMAYMRWSTVYPDDPVERCLSFLVGKSHWEEEDCNSKRGFICKKKKRCDVALCSPCLLVCLTV